MAIDNYSASSDTVISAALAPYTVTPDDDDALPSIPKALYVGGAGDVTLRGVNGAADVVFAGVPAGAILPVRASYVRATGTTATNIVAFA